MAKLLFSVGTVVHGTRDLGQITGVTISYDGDPQEFRGGDYDYPLEIQLGNRTCEVTAEAGVFSADVTGATWLTTGVPVSLVFTTSSNSNGLSGTLTAMKCVSYELVSAQKEFVAASMVFQKQISLEV